MTPANGIACLHSSLSSFLSGRYLTRPPPPTPRASFPTRSTHFKHGQLYACHAAALVHHHMKWTHHEVGKVDIGRMASTLEAARKCGFAISFCRDPSTTTATASAAATAVLPLPVKEEALDVERGHTRPDMVGVGEAVLSRTAQVMTGNTLSATAMARCTSLAGDDGGQRGASVALPRPQGVMHGGNRPHGVAGPSGLAPPSETREFGAGLSNGSTKGCHGRDVRGGGAEGVSVISASLTAKNGTVVEATAISAADSSTRQAPRDGAAVAKAGGVVSPRREGDMSVMDPTHAEGFPAATEGKNERGGVDSSASSEGPPSPSFCRVVVVGAGASGLSAAACLRARGEAGVLILER